MMQGRDFLQLANSLAAGLSEAEWRSAVSRAYYAAFHVARACGFTVPRGERAHAYLWLRLSNGGHLDVEGAGKNLNALRTNRNWADYDLDKPLLQAFATAQVGSAHAIIIVLDAALQEPTKTQVTDAVKVYERDVLKTVTWKP